MLCCGRQARTYHVVISGAPHRASLPHSAWVVGRCVLSMPGMAPREGCGARLESPESPGNGICSASSACSLLRDELLQSVSASRPPVHDPCPPLLRSEVLDSLLNSVSSVWATEMTTPPPEGYCQSAASHSESIIMICGLILSLAFCVTLL